MGKGRLKYKHGPQRGRGRGGYGQVEDEQEPVQEEARPVQREARQVQGGEKVKKHGEGKECKEKQAGGTGSQAEDPQAIRRAKLQAAARLRRELNRQQRFSDVPKFTLRIVKKKVELQKEIQRFVHERTGRYCVLQSVNCQNVPVTSPNYSAKEDASDNANVRPDEVTYHILVFDSENGRLEVLIREYDGYVVAIRPQPLDPNQKDGWFMYADIKLPVHLFGERNFKLVYGSRYSHQELVAMGDDCLDQIVKVLLLVNENNCKDKIRKRWCMLQTLNVFAGEAQRLSSILRFFIIYVKATQWNELGSLSFLTNNWSKISAAVLRVILSLLLNRRFMRNGKAKKQMVEMKDSHMAEAKISVQDFSGNGFPVTRDQFLGKVSSKYLVGMKPRFVREKGDLRMLDHFALGKLEKGAVFGGDVTGDELYLPLLIGYVLLMKYKRKVVPELILHEQEYVDALKDKEEEGESIKMATIHALEFLSRFCSSLEMNAADVEAAQEAVQRSMELDIRRRPFAVVLGVIYMITQLSEDKKTVKDISLATDMAEAIIINAYRELYPYASTLVPDSYATEEDLKKLCKP